MTDRETVELRYRRLRAAIANLDPATVRETFRSVDPSILARLHPALRTSLGRLRSARDPLALLALPHFQPALEYVAQSVTVECLDATRAALGAAADEPTLEQLRAALAEVSERFTADIVAVLLAITAAIDAPAAPACDEVLATDAAYGLRDEDLPAAGAPAGTQAPAPASRPGRGKAKRGGRVTAPHKPWKAAKPGTGAESAANATQTPEESAAIPAGGRRPARLTPKQAADFDPDDGWAGAVVLAEVRYRPLDEEPAHFGAKERPCVVIAGNADALLVRPGYTGKFQRGNWRSVPLAKWHEAGLDRETWIDTDVHEVDRAHASFIGRLAEEDWNSLW